MQHITDGLQVVVQLALCYSPHIKGGEHPLNFAVLEIAAREPR